MRMKSYLIESREGVRAESDQSGAGRSGEVEKGVFFGLKVGVILSVAPVFDFQIELIGLSGLEKVYYGPRHFLLPTGQRGTVVWQIEGQEMGHDTVWREHRGNKRKTSDDVLLYSHGTT